MNENDLSDEAAVESGNKSRCAAINSYLSGWQECRRRAEANRWSQFEDYELQVLAQGLVCGGESGPTKDVMIAQIYKEQRRRKEIK